MSSKSLVVSGFGLAFQDQVVISDLDLALPERGVTVMMGPAGAGKSALLRTLSGANDGLPEVSWWGHVEVDGHAYSRLAAIPPSLRPVLVRQHARFYLNTARENLVSALSDRAERSRPDQLQKVEHTLASLGLVDELPELDRPVAELPIPDQRILAILRALISSPYILFIDEPTSGLADGDARRILRVIGSAAKACAVLVVTHHRGHAQALGGNVAFLAGGRVLETTPAQQFLSEPKTTPGRRFVETGRCDLALEQEDKGALPPDKGPRQDDQSGITCSWRGPRGFHWVIPGKLGGTPRPGIFESLEHDLSGLVRLGVTYLASLEEVRTVPTTALSAHQIHSLRFPIRDMRAPNVRDALRFCESVESLMHSGHTVAFHCRAGLGRTGTMLCCQLIWSGVDACDALERVRTVSPRSVESPEQVEFLSAFEQRLNLERRTVRWKVAR